MPSSYRKALKHARHAPSIFAKIHQTVLPKAADFLTGLKRFGENGRNLAALDLHLDGLIAAHAGDLTRAGALFTAAQTWEASQGYSAGALHTSHQMALASNFKGSLKKLEQYYHETTMTLTKMRNRQGVALCLRSVGEIALVKSDHRELTRAWDLSERLFLMLRLPESSQISVWRACVTDLAT